MRPVIHLIPFVQMFRHKKYPWIQLAGHPGNFLKGIQQVKHERNKTHSIGTIKI